MLRDRIVCHDLALWWQWLSEIALTFKVAEMRATAAEIDVANDNIFTPASDNTQSRVKKQKKGIDGERKEVF